MLAAVDRATPPPPTSTDLIAPEERFHIAMAEQ
jgi:hypothetical protein